MSPAGSSQRGARRKVLAAGAAAGLLVGLAACASDDSELNWESLTSERPFIAYADPALGFDQTVIEQSSGNRVDTKNLSIRVDTVGQATHLSANALRTATHRDWSSTYEIPEAGLVAPDGYAFYATVLTSETSYWHIPDIGHPNEAIFRVVIPDEHTPSYSISRPVLDTTILFLAPEDAEPADYVLSVETEGEIQELSLIDGSRVHSDIEYLYTANNIVKPTADTNIYVTSQDSFGNTDSL